MNVNDLRITELLPGSLHQISGELPLDDRLSWACPTPGGTEVVSLYVLRSGDQAIVIDTGLPVHRDAVLGGIASLVGDARLSIVLTRIEPDTVGNFFAILERFAVDEVVIVANAANPFEFASSFLPAPADVGAHVDKLRRLPAESRYSFAGFELEMIRAPLRVLATVWPFLVREGVLFTSDAFGYSKLGDGDRVVAIDAPLSALELEEVQRHASAKFGWLADSDAGLVLQRTSKVFAGRDVQLVAPNHGKVIAGTPAIESYLAGFAGFFPERGAMGADRVEHAR